MNNTSIYADGSAIGNPGPGGWGATLVGGGKVVELGGYDAHTTNNRMELTAVLEALRKLKNGTGATVMTDSRYVINGITKWVFGWKKNGWQTSQKTEVVNRDLWEALAHEAERHTIAWEHVRGHAGVLGNERVDVIANGFARKETVTLFTGTEEKYKEFLKTMPKPRVVSKSKSKKTGPAYVYLSLVEGKVLSHKTWAECEARVKGKKAKFKKVFSKGEETALRVEWGG